MIFVSHAGADKAVTDAFVHEILFKGLSIPPASVFYSSGHGTGPKAGEYIDGKILGELNSSKMVILFVSHRFMESSYCLCEMGGTWALKKECVFPFILKEMDYTDVPAMFHRSWLKRIDMDTLLEFFDTAKKTLPGIPDNPTAHYKFVAEEFLKQLPDLEDTLPARTMLPPSALTAIEDDNKYLKDKLSELNTQIISLTEENSALKTMKDKEEYAAYRMSKSSAMEIYNELLGRVVSAMKLLKSHPLKKLSYYIFVENGDGQIINEQMPGYGSEFDDAIHRCYFDFVDDGSRYGKYSFSDKSEDVLHALNDLNDLIKRGVYTIGGVAKELTENDHLDMLDSIKDSTGLKPNLRDLDYWEENFLKRKFF